MIDNLLEYRKQMFEVWIHEQIDNWVCEIDAWDNMFDGEFDGDDWHFIKNNLCVTNITIEEIN